LNEEEICGRINIDVFNFNIRRNKKSPLKFYLNRY